MFVHFKKCVHYTEQYKVIQYQDIKSGWTNWHMTLYLKEVGVNLVEWPLLGWSVWCTAATHVQVEKGMRK